MKRNLFILMLLVAVSQLKAQDSALVWLDVGAGTFNSVSSKNGLYVHGSLVKNTRHHVLKGRLAYGDEFNFFDLSAPEPQENFFSLDLMYGYGIFNKIVKLYVSGGIGMISGVRRGEWLYYDNGIFGTDHYEQVDFLSVNFPLQADLQFPLGGHAGLGFSVFTNINPQYPLTGFAFNLSLGRVRW